MNENAQAWVEALRSGEYKQTKGALATGGPDPESFCCLGVACDLYIKAGNKLEVERHEGENEGPYFTFNGEPSILPYPVMEWLGAKDRSMSTYPGIKIDGIVVSEVEGRSILSLAHANDVGASFGQIADVIEAEKDRLFR